MEKGEIIRRRQALARAIESARAQSPVGSPCIGVCRLDPAREHCEGCLRSLAEIAAWKSMSDPARTAVLDRLPERMVYLLPS
jgi:hypothetical protein